MDETAGLPTVDASQLHNLKRMAADPKLSATLVQDDMWLGLLVLLLDGEEESVVTHTLEILKSLANHVEYRSRMQNFLGMMQQLEDILDKSQVSSGLRDLAQQVYNLLDQPSTQSGHSDQGDSLEQRLNGHAPLHDRKDTNTNQPNIATKIGQKGRRNSMRVRGSGLAKTAKTVVLQIKGMINRDDMDLCRSLLVNVRGVISVTFDFKKKRSILRCRHELKPETLVKAITKSITMTAEQVIKDDEGHETFISFSLRPSEVNKENVEMPDYPPDDSPLKGDSELAHVGAAKDSPGGWNFIKSVGQYISSSFYW